MATDKKTPVCLESLGHLSASASAPVAIIEAILEEIGAKPSLSINGVKFYEREVCAAVLQRAAKERRP